MTYADMIQDSQGDLVDIEWFCSAGCYEKSTNNGAEGHAWPGGGETDYNVYCHNCQNLIWKGLSPY